jgi:hypothetical protein
MFRCLIIYISLSKIYYVYAWACYILPSHDLYFLISKPFIPSYFNLAVLTYISLALLNNLSLKILSFAPTLCVAGTFAPISLISIESNSIPPFLFFDSRKGVLDSSSDALISTSLCVVTPNNRPLILCLSPPPSSGIPG